jgi:hypothetical protein
MSDMQRGTLVGLLALFGLLAACNSGGSIDNGLYPGQTDFLNAEPQNGWGYPGMRGGDGEMASGDSNAPAAPPSAAPPQGRTGEVQEADIYRVDQNRLFYLNTYRGFIIYDLADAKNPVLLSRLPIYGYPIEMFVQGNTVYALIRDALYLTQVQGKLQFKRHNTSQLIAVDISDLKNPKVLQTVDIIGELREGVSRKIDNTIYVVSYRDQNYWYGWNYGSSNTEKEQAWVYSFNVADPKNLKLIDQLKVFEGGSYSFHDPNYNTSVSRYFQGVVIAATSNALMVAENWNTNGWVSGSKYNCGSYTSQQQAIVSIIDISDPNGKISTYTKFETYGQVTDQFKQTYFFDETTKKAYYLGILQRREWSSQNCSGTSFTQNALESWDLTDGAAPKQLALLPFGKKNETVRGSVFDPARTVAFAITAQQVDPLYALSYADPAQPKILSEIDGLSGDMDVFRFIGANKFLMGIGRDTGSACAGYGDPNTGTSTNIAVSIIDVQDLSKIRLVQRKCVAVKNAQWISSQLTWNLDQAHKMIGMHSDDTANVITVPVYYYTKNGDDDWWWYNYQTAVGMMSWDLTKYDPSLEPTQQNVLQNHGTLIHPKGEVKRSVVFTHTSPVDRRMVLNLSETHLSLIDIQDLQNPVTQSVVEVAPFQSALFKFADVGGNNYMVEHVRPAEYAWWYGGSQNQQLSEFRVKMLKTGAPLEDQPVVASFEVGQVERVIKYKDNLVLFRRIFQQDKSKPYYGYWDGELQIWSMTTPTQPTKLGTLKLPGSILPYYWYWCGLDAFWGGYWFDGYNENNFVVTDNGLVFLANVYDYSTSQYTRKLVYADLSQPAAPNVKEYVLSSSNTWYFFSLIPDTTDKSGFYLGYRTNVGQVTIDGTVFTKWKYYAQHWSTKGGALTGEYAVNLPGRLMRVWVNGNGQKLLLSHDYTYKKMTVTPPSGQPWSYWQPSFRLNLLRETSLYGGTLAELQDFHHFPKYSLKDMVVDKDKLFVNARQDYWYYYYDETNGPSWEEQSDQLLIYDVSANKLAEAYAAPTGASWSHLMGTFKDRLFIDLPGDGVLVVDVKNVSAPVAQQFLRTLGYSKAVEFSDTGAAGQAFFSAGYFGIYQLDLAAPSNVPAI